MALSWDLRVRSSWRKDRVPLCEQWCLKAQAIGIHSVLIYWQRTTYKCRSSVICTDFCQGVGHTCCTNTIAAALTSAGQCSVPSGCCECISFRLKNLYCFELIQHCAHIPPFSCRREPFISADCSEHHPSAPCSYRSQNPSDQPFPLYLFISASPSSAPRKLHSTHLHHMATLWISEHSYHISSWSPCWVSVQGGPVCK